MNVRYYIRWPKLGLYLFRGTVAYELQVGNCTKPKNRSFSILWAYNKRQPWAEGKRLHFRRWYTR